MNLNFNRQVSIAPMLDYTDRHERYFLRLISKHILLYTEMVTTHALIHSDKNRFLRHSPFEYPLALQLGGSDPKMLAECAKMGEDAGFFEINLNCGCPSDRVQQGSFGACLMRHKDLVAECLYQMQKAVSIPVTLKTRIGIDHDDSFEFFFDFIKTQAEAGCKTFIIHARKAWLKGLSPKENRSIPPLQYSYAIELKKQLPDLHISLNGGVTSIEQIQELLTQVDGVMVGREAYENPWFLSTVDSKVFKEDTNPPANRKDLLRSFLPYIESQLKEGCPLTVISRHLVGLFNGLPGARRYRQILSNESSVANAGIEVITRAMDAVQEESP